MFKKHINAANSRQLGGKDVKKVRADIAKHFPSLTEEQMASLVPPKAVITQTKLSNRSIAYGTEEGTPLFFDPNGHGDKLFPTVRSPIVKKLFETKTKQQPAALFSFWLQPLVYR